MLNPFAAFIGIICAGFGILVMLKLATVRNLLHAVKRGLVSIVAFAVLGSVVESVLPGAITRGFLQTIGSSLMAGVGFIVLALALGLFAQHRSTSNNRKTR